MIINLILIFLVSLFISSLVNYVFLFNQTAIILICSVFLFLAVSIFFFYLDLEFLAIAFSIVYVGGIAVMFLFLILVVDANYENIIGRRVIKFNIWPSIVIALLSVIFSLYFFNYFDPSLFNNYDFYDAACYGFWYDNEMIFDNFFVTNTPLYNAFDLWVLGVSFFEFYSIFLVLVAIHLFVAMVVALIFCTNVFERDINI